MSNEEQDSASDRNISAVRGSLSQTDADELKLSPSVAFLQIERERIDSQNRRTQVASQAGAASNDAVKRHLEFEMAKLAAEDSASKRKDNLARIVIFAFGSFVAVVASLFLYMAFFGNSAQSAIAIEILKVLAVGGGGYGLISGLAGFIRRLMQSK